MGLSGESKGTEISVKKFPIFTLYPYTKLSSFYKFHKEISQMISFDDDVDNLKV